MLDSSPSLSSDEASGESSVHRDLVTASWSLLNRGRSVEVPGKASVTAVSRIIVVIITTTNPLINNSSVLGITGERKLHGRRK